MTYKPDDEMVMKAGVPEGHDPLVGGVRTPV
jgi:hypothetical protein